MLNFAEQTGSGAVMLVWSFPLFKTPAQLLSFTSNAIHAFSNLSTLNLANTGRIPYQSIFLALVQSFIYPLYYGFTIQIGQGSK